jgi:hypothetical protein
LDALEPAEEDEVVVEVVVLLVIEAPSSITRSFSCRFVRVVDIEVPAEDEEDVEEVDLPL